MDQMILACRAVRRGAERALVSCDFPFGPLQEGPEPAVRAAIRLVKEGGADLVKLDGAAGFPEAVRAITAPAFPCGRSSASRPTRPSVRRHGQRRTRPGVAQMKDKLIEEARLLEAAGASLLDFTNSGPVAGPEVAGAVGDPGRSAGSAAGRGWTGASGPPSPRSATWRRPSTTRSSATRTSPRSRSTPSRRFAEDVRAGRQIRGAAGAPDEPGRRPRSLHLEALGDAWRRRSSTGSRHTTRWPVPARRC